ncbi:ATP-binding protein [Pseudomonas sp. F(2018)]|uniref:ATP-binding protein n=1 Tax=Pseudomonas TaxID=286 RepID=UPI0010F9B72D|nr:ATP-binding protein [Pseudomonas sp. F(2018)]
MDIKNMRPVSIGEHPVSNRTYLMPTHSIGETYAMVLKVIRRRDSGLVIYGRVRYGKTSAMMYCRQCLNIDHPNIPVKIYNAKRDISPHKGNFYVSLLEVVGHAKSADRCSTSIKHSRLVNFIADAALNDPHKVFILFIDEASRLEPLHYDWIKDVYNDLMLRGVTLLPILVGQHELQDQKEALLKTGEEGEAIVNRFMLYEHPFRGIRDKEDFIECLGYYDSATYPEESGWSYTRFFLPEAFDAGVRLQSYGEMLWNGFKESYSALNIKAEMEVPMKYFTKTIEMFLTENSDSDSSSFSLSKDACMKLIKESWFQAAMANSKTAHALR